MAKNGSKPKRIRRDFTQSEDQHLVEFLAKYDAGARASILPYRTLVQKSWGANHSAESWLGRYTRMQPLYKTRMPNQSRKSAGY
ncbi:hypothetical protein C8R44DRAFT_252658 [Mycena epipterygia]|nr:hypothetical protein C8R44DRAFT_252658 [Mycena epipterygia]